MSAAGHTALSYVQYAAPKRFSRHFPRSKPESSLSAAVKACRNQVHADEQQMNILVGVSGLWPQRHEGEMICVGLI